MGQINKGRGKEKISEKKRGSWGVNRSLEKSGKTTETCKNWGFNFVRINRNIRTAVDLKQLDEKKRGVEFGGGRRK